MAKYNQRPEMALQDGVNYAATIELESGGRIDIELYAADAPETVNSFVFLARDGYYDGVTFHRIIKGFMAQGGDPTGRGTGGPGYNIPDEVNGNKHNTEGTVAMAKTAAPDSAGSQFYITFEPTPFLDSDYTVFGRVTSGMDVVHGLPARDPERAREPGPAMKTITISES